MPHVCNIDELVCAMEDASHTDAWLHGSLEPIFVAYDPTTDGEEYFE